MASTRDRAGRVPASVVALMLLGLLLGTPPARSAESLPDAETLDHNLDQVEKALQNGAARKRDLDELANSVEQELQRLRQALVQAAAATQQREAALTAVEDRLAELKSERTLSAASLGIKKRQLAQVSGALRRLAARPPIAMVASPADPLDTVHTAMLLSAVAPALRRDARQLATEIARHEAVERGILEEKRRLASATAGLERERETVAALLAQKQKARQSMAKERSAVVDRLNALAASARDLRDLMQKIERHKAAGDEARERLNTMVQKDASPSAESTVAPGAAPADSANTATGTGALSPDFVADLPQGPEIGASKGGLTFPAAGEISQRYGTANRLGLTEQGVVIATRENAQVVAPFDGKVIYAGPFRGYGQIVMIEHGQDYLTLMAGMSAIDVQVGQGVLAGEPVARMGEIGTGADGTEGLYVEFRHNGAPIDPIPWWSARTNKVRR
ncbi:peptidoglycan DD-metalloendopeptidase family protein [Nisaea sp.]|uniref:murein hydrolase activator EnvC family protein n=1 Tax=Nisaea sp. TaxID=2024842 RepID=UPI0032F070B1